MDRTLACGASNLSSILSECTKRPLKRVFCLFALMIQLPVDNDRVGTLALSLWLL